MKEPKEGRGSTVRYYYVDEAGDGVLFDAKGKIIIGNEGCSRFYILGLLDIANPEILSKDLQELRKRLLSDPYFKKVPSMQPGAKKTALAFHAKDDVPEVRREVFNLLRQHNLRFFAIVKTKKTLIDYVLQRNERESAYRYNPNELYDYLVRRLFRDRLHKDDEYHIFFAKRGKSDRTGALRKALEGARQNFYNRWNITRKVKVNVIPSSSPANPGLQAVDYFLWTLQRLYERREDRYLEFLWPSFRLVDDIDDTREAKYGVYYTQKKPLNLAALKALPEI